MIAKNENLIARRLNSNGCVGDVLAVTPDLITIIDSDTGMTKIFNCHNKLHCMCEMQAYCANWCVLYIIIVV